MIWIALAVVVAFVAGVIARPYLPLPVVTFTDPRDEVGDE